MSFLVGTRHPFNKLYVRCTAIISKLGSVLTFASCATIQDIVYGTFILPLFAQLCEEIRFHPEGARRLTSLKSPVLFALRVFAIYLKNWRMLFALSLLIIPSVTLQGVRAVVISLSDSDYGYLSEGHR